MIHIAVFVMASIVSIFGVGGGVFYVPLILSFGFPFHQATNASLLIILVTGLSSFIVFQHEGMVDWRLALLLDPVKDLGALLGGFFSYWFGEGLLSVLFAVILVVGGVLMYRYQEEAVMERAARPNKWKRHVGGGAYAVNLYVVLPFCLAAGFLSGLLGIGGGIFMVPLMALFIGVPMKVAVATSSFMVCLTGAFGFTGGLLAGHLHPSAGLFLVVAAFLGAQIGPRVTVRLDKDRLRKAFVLLMFVVASLMLYRGVA